MPSGSTIVSISVIGILKTFLTERGITVSREAIRLWYPKHSLRLYGAGSASSSELYTPED